MRLRFLAVPFAVNSVLSIIWMGSLARMGVNVETILSIMSGILVSGFDRITALLLSADTLLFLVLSPLTFAIIAVFSALARDGREAMAVGFAGSTPIITGALYFSNLTYAMTAIFLVAGSVVSALFTFRHARNFKTIPAYGTGSGNMKRIIMFIAVGAFLATYMGISSDYEDYKGIIKDSMSRSLMNMSASMIPGGGTPEGLLEQQLRSPEYRELYIQTTGDIMYSMFDMMSRDSVVSPIVNQSLDRGALIAALSLSGQELNDSPSAIIDILLPLMRERTRVGITNYFRNSGEILADHLKEQTEAEYEGIIGSIVGESNNTSMGDFISEQGSGLIDSMLDSGPLGSTLESSLPLGLAFLMFSLITLAGSVVLSPLAGLYSMLLLKRVEKLVKKPVPGKVKKEKEEAENFVDEIKKQMDEESGDED